MEETTKVITSPHVPGFYSLRIYSDSDGKWWVKKSDDDGMGLRSIYEYVKERDPDLLEILVKPVYHETQGWLMPFLHPKEGWDHPPHRDDYQPISMPPQVDRFIELTGWVDHHALNILVNRITEEVRIIDYQW